MEEKVKIFNDDFFKKLQKIHLNINLRIIMELIDVVDDIAFYPPIFPFCMNEVLSL